MDRGDTLNRETKSLALTAWIQCQRHMIRFASESHRRREAFSSAYSYRTLRVFFFKVDLHRRELRPRMGSIAKLLCFRSSALTPMHSARFHFNNAWRPLCNRRLSWYKVSSFTRLLGVGARHPAITREVFPTPQDFLNIGEVAPAH